jgi:hypothetical protein
MVLVLIGSLPVSRRHWPADNDSRYPEYRRMIRQRLPRHTRRCSDGSYRDFLRRGAAGSGARSARSKLDSENAVPAAQTCQFLLV